MNRKLALVYSSIVLVGMLLSSCGVTNSIENASAAVDRALAILPRESDQWLEALEDAQDRLVDAGQSTLANEVERLIAATVARTGGEFRCEVDFLRDRARETLESLKIALDTGADSIAPHPPVICQWDSQSVDLHLEPERRASLEFWGYNLDHADPSGDLMRLYLVQRTEAFAGGEGPGSISSGPLPGETWVDQSRHLSHTTKHYSGVINISGNGVPVEEASATHLVISWGEQILSTIPILRPAVPEEKTETVTFQHEFSFVPPLIRGDRDFSGSVDLSARARIERHPTDETKLIFGITMQAAEPESDWTTAEGDSWHLNEHFTIWEAPAGFEIVEIVSPANPWDTFEFQDDDHEDDTFIVSEMTATIAKLAETLSQTPLISEEMAYMIASSLFDFTNNGLVTKWKFVGDTDGGEAGTRTRVSVWLNDVVVRIRESGG